MNWVSKVPAFPLHLGSRPMILRLAAALGFSALLVWCRGAAPSPASPAHGATPVPTRYRAEDGAVVGRNLDAFNNRPLYCANTNAFILTGDRPLVRFARGDRHYGTLLLGVGAGNGENLWLHESDEVTTFYRAGRMTWTIRSSRLPGLTLTWEVQPAAKGVGLTARVTARGVRPGDRLIWAYGGASRKLGTNLSNALDTLTMPAVRQRGFEPELCAGNRLHADGAGFSLQADDGGPRIRGRCSAPGPLLVGDADQVVTPLVLLGGARRAQETGAPDAAGGNPARPFACGVVPLDATGEVFWSFLADGEPAAAPSAPADTFAAASVRTAALAARVVVDTPDPFLNAAATAAAAAIDGVWYPPVFVHGAMMWNMRFPGWRTVYGGTAYGWHERVRAQADYYLASQETKTSKNSFAADPATLLTEAARDSRFYGRGRLTRDQKFYNMQSQFFEQLIHAWRWTGDPTLEARLRPALELHLEWMRECFDPDGDGTYESYINTWPTDSVWFNGGGTPDETAYAYSGHQAARDLARRAGEAAEVARHEAALARIREGFFRHLWNPTRGHPGLYREQGGHRRLHDDAWLYSIFLPIGAGLLDSEQALTALRYTEWGLQNDRLPTGGRRVWTSNFVPGFWSVREMWPGDNHHLALAYFQAGLGDDGWDVFRGNFVHSAFNQPSPGNLGAPQGGTDFGDCVHPFARTLIEGLIGYAPDYPNQIVRLAPQFPADWGHAQIRTPDFSLRFDRKESVTTLRLRLSQPAPIDLLLPIRAHRVVGATVNGRRVPWQAAPGYGCTRLQMTLPAAEESVVEVLTAGSPPALAPAQPVFPDGSTRRYQTHRTEVRVGELPQWRVTATPAESFTAGLVAHALPVAEIPAGARWAQVDLASYRNADLRAIFRQQYLSPRPATISVRLGSDGYSPWTFPHWKSGPPEIGFESVPGLLAAGDPSLLRTPQGVPFAWTDGTRNIAFTSLWDNFPHAFTVPVGRAAEAAWFLVAGSTNPMQGRIANAVLRLRYADGAEQRLELVPPFNFWNLCPVKAGATAAGQDSRTYYTADTDAFAVPQPWPETVALGANCRAVLLSQRLRPGVTLADVTLEALSQEVVIGLLGITLLNPRESGGR